MIEHALRNRHNLNIAWIDYKKAYDSLPHSWILESLRLYKVSYVIIEFLAYTMTMWKVDLVLKHAEGITVIKDVVFSRGIYQGDALSPLLFVLALNPISCIINSSHRGYEFEGIKLTHLFYMDDLKLYARNKDELAKMIQSVSGFSLDICMEFGLSKCKIVNILEGKYAKMGRIHDERSGDIEELETEECYRYLGVDELDDVKHKEMKEEVAKEVKRRVKLLVKTELNARNLFKAIGELAIPVASYTFGVLNWTESELKEIDVAIRKIMHMYKAIEIRSDIDRLYISR